MVGRQRRANSGNDNNNNQKRDHRDAILEGLGEQLRQIQECLERLEAAGLNHIVKKVLLMREFTAMDIDTSKTTLAVKMKTVLILLLILMIILVMKRIFILKFLLAIIETIFTYVLIFLSLRESLILMDLLIG